MVRQQAGAGAHEPRELTPPSSGQPFADRPKSFMDHVTECLLFGQKSRRGVVGVTSWRLGNRDIDAEQTRIAGWVGFWSEDAEEQDDYDDQTASWRSTVVATPRRAHAPFAVRPPRTPPFSSWLVIRSSLRVHRPSCLSLC